jgi:NLI interacting factor-like phosphatase
LLLQTENRVLKPESILKSYQLFILSSKKNLCGVLNDWMTSLQKAAADGESSKRRWTRKEKSVRAAEKERGRATDPKDIGTGKVAQSTKKVVKKSPLTPGERMISAARKALTTDSILFDEDLLKSDSEIRVLTACVLPSEPLPSTVHLKPLIVLDLNGILCHRLRKSREDLYPHLKYRPSPICIANTPIIPRIHLRHFLTFLDAHFTLAVWTSAKIKTAKLLVSLLIPEEISKKLLFVWAQHHCHVIPGEAEPIFVKNLEKVWGDFPLWNPSNTLLMDDSPDKCPVVRSAIHPPALHGKVSGDESVISDTENESRQMSFFQDLTIFFSTGEVKNPADLQAFLEKSASGHMGWRGLAVNKTVVKAPTPIASLSALRPSQVVSAPSHHEKNLGK